MIDDEFNSKGYIVPGLGNPGIWLLERNYRKKLR
jgi:uracil phosphoribosyltransferase